MTPNAGIESIRTTGIAVDSDGFVYVANNVSGTPAATILKIKPDPTDSPTLAASSSFAFSNPYDVLVKGDNVYVSDPGASTPQIARLAKDLGSAVSLSGYGSDSFLGPERFVATLNRPITVIDETPYTNQGNRLVSFNDITGAGWMTYEPQIDAVDEFVFFYQNNVP